MIFINFKMEAGYSLGPDEYLKMKIKFFDIS